MRRAGGALALTVAVAMVGTLGISSSAVEQLPVRAVDEADASLRLGLTAYHDIARRLSAVAAASDRVSTEVIATTAGGRRVLMVTLTEPESPAQRERQEAMGERLTTEPAAAAEDASLARSYRLPVLVSANVHGNEWEGTDAALRLVEDYATSDDPDVERLLRTTRVHLVLSANPDGRTAGTRANAAGFDLNRDLITGTQPETVGLRNALIRTRPALVLDLHGYVNGTLVEPTTAPHGENYELDLLLKHSYPNALGIEEAVDALGLIDADGVRPPQLPARDWEEGWDGWPPIFLPQYAALHGAVGHTVEVPLRVNNASYELPEDELERRSRINTDIAHAAITATLEYAAAHREELLADQVEIFRRGAAGEAQTPVEEGAFGVPGQEDVYLTQHPRAYVIPAGEKQRSAPAAARLVGHLMANDIEVGVLPEAATIGGRTYEAGSHVVDMHQAKRAVAGALLGPGTDLSERVDAMYDISGWSLSLLWGADVHAVPSRTPWRVDVEPVGQLPVSGSLARADADGWVLPMKDPADVAALATLLGQGIPVELLEDGAVLVPGDFPWAAGNVVSEHGVKLDAAPEGAEGERLGASAHRVGVAGTAEERWAFEEMGLVVEPVSTSALNDGLDLADLDALYVSAGLDWQDLDRGGRQELRSFVAGGGGLVGRGRVGAEVNLALDLLDVTAVPGRSDANGVVRVDADPASPVAGAASPHTFVYSPTWFTDLGDGVRADQRYAETDVVVAGHWGLGPRGRGGPEDAAGEAVVVSGEAEPGARVVLMGSEPLFRAHPKGQYALVARALLWAGVSDS